MHLVIICGGFFLLREPQKRLFQKQLAWIELKDQPIRKLAHQEPNKISAKKTQRVVQTELEKKTTQTKADAFLGLQNQNFEKQTINTQRTLSQSQLAQSPIRTGKANKASSHRNLGNSGNLAKFGLARFGLKLNTQLFSKAKPDQGTPPEASKDTSQDDLNRAPAQGGIQEYVKGISDGNRTALNTREYIFYGYFQRIQKSLDQAWTRELKEKLVKYFKSGRSLAEDAELTTRVIVVLNELGEITKIQLMEESGIQDLDEIAVRAFNQAGPFPNPPKGMIDTNREVKIPWSFVLRT